MPGGDVMLAHVGPTRGTGALPNLLRGARRCDPLDRVYGDGYFWALVPPTRLPEPQP